MRDKTRETAGIGVLLTLAGSLLVACGGSDPVAVPDVVGQQLDHAHNQLHDAGFEELTDVDKWEDREPLRDASWVVIAQRPTAQKQVDIGATITLTVGKQDEERTLALLPADSPVLIAARADQAAKAAEEAEDKAAELKEQRQERADQLATLRTYVDSLDPTLRLARNAVRETDKYARGVADRSYTGTEEALLGAQLNDLLTTMRARLAAEEPPDEARRGKAHADLVSAADRFTQAGETLTAAITGARKSSVRKYRQIVAEATTQWNDALTRLYRDSGRRPPLFKA
jgi:hypothetical protein